MVKATQSGSFKAVKLPPAQTAVARCYSLIDIGTVEEFFNNQAQGKKQKIYVTFEFPNLKAQFRDDRDLEPFVLGMEMTLSTNENSNLAKLIAAWRNKPLTPEEQKGFDVNQMVGKTAMMSFIHNRKKAFATATISNDEITNENTALKFNGIMPKPKEVPCPAMLNPEMIWDWGVIAETGTFDAEKFMKIPKWLRAKIKASDEFAKYGYDPEDQGSGQPAQATPTAESSEPVSDGDGW